jgi:hypothetical protein
MFDTKNHWKVDVIRLFLQPQYHNKRRGAALLRSIRASETSGLIVMLGIGFIPPWKRLYYRFYLIRIGFDKLYQFFTSGC